jgi:hypothetical protein
VVYKKPRIKTKTARGVSLVRNVSAAAGQNCYSGNNKGGQYAPKRFAEWHTKKLKNRLKGVSISRNVSLIFNKKRLIYIPNPGGAA